MSSRVLNRSFFFMRQALILMISSSSRVVVSGGGVVGSGVMGTISSGEYGSGVAVVDRDRTEGGRTGGRTG